MKQQHKPPRPETLDLSHRVSASLHLMRGSDCKHSSETGYCEGGKNLRAAWEGVRVEMDYKLHNTSQDQQNTDGLNWD